MGTSGAYTGAGGKAGKKIGNGLSDWLAALLGGPGNSDSTPSSNGTEEGEKPVTELPPEVISGLMGLLSPRSSSAGSSDGPGAGGAGIVTSGGATRGASDRTRAGSGRSSQRLASVGGRAAAGAYAYVRGDLAELDSMGLNYGELRDLDDPLEVTRQIVDAVCGQQADGRLEEAEERYVAAAVADWVLEQGEDGDLPDVDDVARYAIATIVTEILSSELGDALRDQPDEVTDVAEDELRDAATVLAMQTELSTLGPTVDELTKAIEDGIEKLREIYGGES